MALTGTRRYVEVTSRSIGAWFPTDPDPADEPEFRTPVGQPTIE
jgi:hypothetical protein